MKILAIDPGPEKSAVVRFDGVTFDVHEILFNREAEARIPAFLGNTDLVAIEGVACYGMPVGVETFQTCYTIGRLQHIVEQHSREWCLIYRKDVKMHLCQSMRAKDSNIRCALLDRFGQQGNKHNPGVLYGISSHLWAAVAVAVTAHDTKKEQS